MLIIPAIDLLDNKAVRLYQGDYNQVTVYNEDPVLQALEFAEAGVLLIHLVDLNAARTGDRSVNSRTIEKIAEAIRHRYGHRIYLELGGGIRNHEALEHYFGLGIERAILGTAAVRDPQFLKEALDKHGPERIIVGVDARDGMVRIEGWEGDAGAEVFAFLKKLEKTGVREIIYTDIRTDGTLKGPATDTIRRILEQTHLRVIASGGVGSFEDLVKLKQLNSERLAGVIAGKAVYEKKFDLAYAVREITNH